jgi:glycine cleavage system transcriptional repressor
MAEEAVVAASGVDRPGVMDELSQFLMECGVNVIDSRSINLRGEFSLLMLVRGSAEALEAVRQGSVEFGDHGIRFELCPARQATAATFPHLFIATGKDQAGVLHRISHLLRVLNVNIDDITTHVAADDSFEIRLRLSVPRETPISMLKDYLTYLCTELGIQGELKQA